MDQITQLLQSIANQLGVSVEYLWPYLVRYTFANHLTLLITNLVGVLVSGFLVWLGAKLVRTHWGCDVGIDYPSKEFLAFCFGCLLVLLFSLIGWWMFESASGHVAGVLVPEAQAIIDIVGKVTARK